ncbi:hypothetical protein BD779DRAFT_1673470 [Infundibulicybe gibba]|nr:hypothetical protein BD779DRAFT_1673470 [Infundibulicybe gibba]
MPQARRQLRSHRGGFHSGGKGVDKFSRVTALIRDGDKNQLYFYRTTDKTFWDRVHIPESDSGTDWPSTPMYIGITKGDFDAKKPPE